MKHTLKQLFLLSLLALVISGCSSRPLIAPEEVSAEPNAELWHWQIEGRLALNDGQERHNANFNWQQQGAHYQLSFFGPLGQGSARLDGQPFHVSLTTSSGEQLHAASPEGLIRQGLGWQLPLSNLVYWVRGLPAPGPSQEPEPGRLIQDDWEIEWQRFTQVEGYQLPGLVIARQGHLQIRLAISRWSLNLSETHTTP